MLTKIMMFAMAIASRGFANNKIDIETKKLRYISCYGLNDIKPCQYLAKSQNSEHHYCGACNCGDHAHTWLTREEGVYSKLDYPSLNCPLSMPGFSNYDPNSPKQSLERKKQIENLDLSNFQFVNLTVSVDPEKEKIFERVSNMLENS